MVTPAEAAGGEKPVEGPQPMAQPGPYPIAQPVPVQPRPMGGAMMGQVCAKCSTENRPIAKYCRACGFKLSLTPSQTQELRMRLAGVDIVCQNCGQLNRPIAKFCGRCGSRTINSFAPQPAGAAP
jgi:ribosomal protein L40E